MTKDAIVTQGDVVILKSGGAKMTVVGKTQLGLVLCVWHDIRHVPHSAEYAPALLLKVVS